MAEIEYESFINESGEVVRVKKGEPIPDNLTPLDSKGEIPTFTSPKPEEPKFTINEYGEIERGSNQQAETDTNIPTFTPPENEGPVVEPVDPNVLKQAQQELFPETYGDKKPEILIEKTIKESELASSKEMI